MTVIKTFSCLVIFLKILVCMSQILHTNPKLELYTTNSDRYSSSLENSDEAETQEFSSLESDEHLPSWLYFREDDETDEASPEIILSRAKRRIFPGVGKALDRDRGSRNPWIRGRESFDDNQRTSTAFKRSGPMGSDLLYALYPDLAPPDWSDHNQQYAEGGIDEITPEPTEEEILRMEETLERKKKKRERDVEELRNRRAHVSRREPVEYTYGATSYHADEKPLEAVTVPQPKPKKTYKSKGKIPKQLKEDIAKHAEEHGVNQALSYYKNLVDFQLRRGAVEKFVRRYRRRQERQRLRKLIRS